MTNKKPQPQLELRHADVEMILNGLKLLPEDLKKTVTYSDLVRRLDGIKKQWAVIEKKRKDVKKAVLKSKAFRSKNPNSI